MQWITRRSYPGLPQTSSWRQQGWSVLTNLYARVESPAFGVRDWIGCMQIEYIGSLRGLLIFLDESVL